MKDYTLPVGIGVAWAGSILWCLLTGAVWQFVPVALGTVVLAMVYKAMNSNNGV